MNVSKVDGDKNYSYEIEVKVRLPDYIAKLRKAEKQKGEALAAPPAPDVELTKGQKFVKNFAKATASIPGHVYFSLRVKDGEKTVAEDDIGYTYARELNIKKITKQKGPGVHGFLQNQALKDPRYDFSEKFDNVLSFVDENTKNPPNYTWPIAYNCVKFAQKTLNQAGIKGAKITGLSNLPMETVFRIQSRKKLSQIKEKVSKLKKRRNNNQEIISKLSKQKTR